MQVFRYPAGTLSGDYLRSAAGVGLGVGVLTTVPIGWAIGLIFGGLAGAFGLFGARTLERHITRVAVSDGEIARAALGTRVIPWDRLDNAKLRYYGTRRQQKNKDGFMQLTLRGAGTSMTFESNLEGFDYIVWRTARAARANGVSLDPASAGNMLTLEIDPDNEAPPPPHVAELHENVRSGN
ncbi:hypothetical protein [Ferruginivarius sediminum]|uniref:Uncharacterized protein n=1 Tax=Ferruginivarius sediminum TaxID=2661937 RepID=A0A369TD74_9PROT|nr:hypothetical protein [Ferruginivarius sediminum]RDD63238.1 hypothetical protein DRB17_01955 [Ferruginivarius sediminum]